ncbi:hypothetical protein D9613_011207 [Agrocybe pediades]|uniref:DDE Tnp4 domain-containing protein n=1 Tax=Agrocybe pediades TaxID=84607 RepID=A0A8H4QLX5_9AGAR|nr:hypothetical protein D9613_011207 [Agrocybe pediades]
MFAELESKVSLSLDAWTSSNQFTFIAIIAHCVSNNGVLEELLVDFKVVFGEHSGANMAASVWATLELYELLSKVFVMDNASNNDTMLKSIEEHCFKIFALIPSTVSRYIKFSLSILLKVLWTIPEGRIVWPEGDEFQANNDLVLDRHPLLTGAFGTMDGLNVMVQESAIEEIENVTFNGWLHEHFVSSVFAFGASGSWHDARVAHPIYEKLRTATPEGYYLVTDTAFP